MHCHAVPLLLQSRVPVGNVSMRQYRIWDCLPPEFRFAFASTMPGTSPRCSIPHPTRALPHSFSVEMGAPSPWMAAPYHTWKCSYSLPKKYGGPAPHSQLMGEARSSRTPPDPACRISCPTARPARRALNTAEGADLARRVPPSTTGHGQHDQVPCCVCGHQ